MSECDVTESSGKWFGCLTPDTFSFFFAYDSDQAVIIHTIVSDGESQADTLLDKRPRGEQNISGGVFQGAPAGSQFQHQVEAGKD